MGWAEQRRSRLEAESLRHRLGLEPTIKANPFDVAQSLDIDVILAPFGHDNSVEGVYLRDAGRPTIFINSSRYRRPATFTCAHELGHHHLLHPDDDRDFIDTKAELYDRQRHQDDIEREANIFATEFLMPEEGVRQVISGTSDPEVATGRITRAFGTSPITAAIRLREIEFIDQAGLTALTSVLENERDRFRAEQAIPYDKVLSRELRLPSRFRRDIDRLFRANVITSDRRDELLDRPIAIAD